MIICLDSDNAAENILWNIMSSDKTVVLGAAFRIVKQVFSQLENIIPDFVPVKKKTGVDYCQINNFTFCPIGNGDRIRGMRPTHIILINKEQISKDVIDAVLDNMTGESP